MQPPPGILIALGKFVDFNGPFMLYSKRLKVDF